jgi:uncharacterized protein (DUF885 family)
MRNVIRRHSPVHCGIWLLAVAWGCTGEATDGVSDGGSNSITPAERLSDLADRYWDWRLSSDPFTATYLGDSRFDDRVADNTPAGRASKTSRVSSFFDELETVDVTTLRGQDRVTHLALEEELRSEIARQTCEEAEWNVNYRNGPHVAFLNIAAVQPTRTVEDGRRLLRRWSAMAVALDEWVANLRAGRERDRTPPRVGIRHTLSQLEGLLAQPVGSWPLYSPARRPLDGWSQSDRDAFRLDLRQVVEEEIRPAYVRLRDFLGEELSSVARTGDQIGVSSLPGGEACYQALIRAFTTLDLSPGEIHEIGLAEVARVRGELESVGERVFGTPDIGELQTRLWTDPAMHFQTAGEIVRTAEQATERGRAVMSEWFGRVPRAQMEVREVPDYEAPYQTVAYYRQPALDGSRPGTYFVNTYLPETRTRYEAEALAFHEGIPGHHFQIAIAQELTELPDFRRHVGPTAFLEGWPLYAETLADEMGLYTGDLDQLGRLSFDAWRASRLVVDTGIHAFGWTRDQAVDYLQANTLLSEANIQIEVDRYTVWPAQALTYKLGQREILRLREEARERLGDHFSIQDFHDRVLENGAVSLATLGDIVERWIVAQEASP